MTTNILQIDEVIIPVCDPVKAKLVRIKLANIYHRQGPDSGAEVSVITDRLYNKISSCSPTELYSTHVRV